MPKHYHPAFGSCAAYSHRPRSGVQDVLLAAVRCGACDGVRPGSTIRECPGCVPRGHVFRCADVVRPADAGPRPPGGGTTICRADAVGLVHRRSGPTATWICCGVRSGDDPVALLDDLSLLDDSGGCDHLVHIRSAGRSASTHTPEAAGTHWGAPFASPCVLRLG